MTKKHEYLRCGAYFGFPVTSSITVSFLRFLCVLIILPSLVVALVCLPKLKLIVLGTRGPGGFAKVFLTNS